MASWNAPTRRRPLGKTSKFFERGGYPRLADDGAPTATTGGQDPLGFEFAQCLPNGTGSNVELFGELTFAGQLTSALIETPGNCASNGFCDVVIPSHAQPHSVRPRSERPAWISVQSIASPRRVMTASDSHTGGSPSVYLLVTQHTHPGPTSLVNFERQRLKFTREVW